MQESQPRATRQRVVYAAAGVVAVGLFCWYANSEAALANQAFAPSAETAGLFTHVQEIEGRATRVIIIDPAMRVMAVYEIGREKAQIKLLSTRNFSYDMQMLGYKSDDPSPEAIKNGLGRQ